jgi:hypothetical protein
MRVTIVMQLAKPQILPTCLELAEGLAQMFPFLPSPLCQLVLLLPSRHA